MGGWVNSARAQGRGGERSSCCLFFFIAPGCCTSSPRQVPLGHSIVPAVDVPVVQLRAAHFTFLLGCAGTAQVPSEPQHWQMQSGSWFWHKEFSGTWPPSLFWATVRPGATAIIPPTAPLDPFYATHSCASLDLAARLFCNPQRHTDAGPQGQQEEFKSSIQSSRNLRRLISTSKHT